MEDSRSSVDMSLRPQMFLFGCELKGDKKEFHFKGGDDENEHHLCLKTISLGAGAKDELNIVEAEGMSFEGKAIKVTLASLKMSVQPTVSLGGFEIQAPVTLRLKSGSGPLYIGGQHIVALEEDFESDEEGEEGEEEEDDNETNRVDNETNRVAGKRAAAALSAKLPQKKAKLLVKEEEDDDEDDDDDDDDDEDDDDEDEEESPVKKAVQDSKPQKSSQNGKISKTSTPASTPKQKTPEKKAQEKKPQTPKTPKVPLTMEEVKAKMLSGIEKGVALPKLEQKFQNYVKHGLRIEDPKIIQELWQWRQSLKDGK